MTDNDTLGIPEYISIADEVPTAPVRAYRIEERCACGAPIGDVDPQRLRVVASLRRIRVVRCPSCPV